MPTTADRRDSPTGSSLLELSGTFAGQVLSTQGGDATADIIEEKLGSDRIVRKHLANPRYTDIELECDGRMEHNFFDWIRNTLNHNFTRQSGAISFPDFDYQVESRVEFANALLTGVTFPALDTGSKDAVSMTVKLTPQYTRRQKGPGQLPAPPVGPRGLGGWTAANFRLQIDGLDCKHVTKIEPLIFTTVVAKEVVGELRDYQQEPAHLDVRDLVLTVPESDAASFYAWHEDFVVNGMNDQQHEKNGMLELLGPNLKDVLLTLELRNLGIFRLASVEPSTIGGIAQVRASMYCEEITLAADSNAPPSKQDGPESPIATGGGPTPRLELKRMPPAIGTQADDAAPPQTEDGVGRTPQTATFLTVPPGTSLERTGIRGPARPAWFYVTMPCSDSCTARLQMTGGPTFDLYSGPSFSGQAPLARGLTLGDVFLSPERTQYYVNVWEGPWANYKLTISRS